MDIKKSKKIAIFGHYGNKNYGDESIIENLNKIIPDVELFCFSLNPEDSHINHNVKAYPIRRMKEKKKKNPVEKQQTELTEQNKKAAQENDSFKKKLKGSKVFTFLRKIKNIIKGLKELPDEFGFFKESYKNIKDFDLLIVTGSNQFLDNFGGTWGFPYTLLKWSILCKIAGVKMAYASVGAGPLDRSLSKFFIHLAILGKSFISYRDNNSKKLVEKTIFPINGQVYPDLAHSLNYISKNNVSVPKVVGINPMPVYDRRYWYTHDDHLFQSYLKRMAKFIEELIAQKYQVFMFNTMIKDLNVAYDIIDTLPESLRNKVSVKEAKSVDSLMSIIDSADLIIPTRFHGTILSLLADKPVLAICYYRKTRDIMTEMGQEKYTVDIETFEFKELWQLFNILVANYKKEKNKIIDKNKEFRDLLDEQYLELKKIID